MEHSEYLMSALIPVASVLLTLLGAVIADALREQRVFRYRLQSEIFFMKVKLYEELVRTIAQTVDDQFFCAAIFKDADDQKFNAVMDALLDLQYRVGLIGSEQVERAIGEIFHAATAAEKGKEPMEAFVEIGVLFQKLKKILRADIEQDVQTQRRCRFFKPVQQGKYAGAEPDKNARTERGKRQEDVKPHKRIDLL